MTAPAASTGGGRGGGVATHLFLLCCVAMVGAFFYWAAVGRLEVVSAAPGTVIPASQVKKVQHLEGGIVREIMIEEGADVRAGQSLVVLEPTRSDAEVDELRARLDALRIDIARLHAEVSGATPDFPQDLSADEPAQVRQALALFETRRQRLESELEAQRQAAHQREAELKEVRARLKNTRRSLELAREQLQISQRLLKLSLTNRMGHLEIQREIADLQSAIDADEAAVPRLQAARDEALARLDGITAAFIEDARDALADVERNFREKSQRLRKLEDSLRRTVLRAPVDGVVKTLHVTTVGEVVPAGGTVAELVPAGDRLVVEARLATRDVGYVHPGQPVSLRLASGDAVRFGALDGTVVHVSPDAVVDDDGQPYYRVRIEPAAAAFEKAERRYPLVPGMGLDCSILTGTRTVLEYLLAPYLETLEKALRER